MLRGATNGPSLLSFLFLTVWAGDTVAMYAGRMFGRRKLAPNLSPNKTWAGAIGSVLGAVAVAGILLVLSTYLAQLNSVRLSFADGRWWYWLRPVTMQRRWANFSTALKRGMAGAWNCA